jgi:hypothetical protein
VTNGICFLFAHQEVFSFSMLCLVLALAATAKAFAVDIKDPPRLPLNFNATLLKIGTENKAWPAWWTKTYYEYNPDEVLSSYHRFDFYDHYLNLDNQWSTVCSILFRDGKTYSIYPEKDAKNETCYLTHTFLPVLSPNWLNGATLEGVVDFKGMKAERWRLGEVGSPDTIYFYAKAGYGSKHAIPLRSTNQANDPGATDWFDFTVGPQDSMLFNMPKSCIGKIERDPANPGCPPDALPPLLFQGV